MLREVAVKTRLYQAYWRWDGHPGWYIKLHGCQTLLLHMYRVSTQPEWRMELFLICSGQDNEHGIWNCCKLFYLRSFARQCWLLTNCGWWGAVMIVQEWFEVVRNRVSKEEVQEAVTVCWELWNARNRVLWEQKRTNAAAVYQKTQNCLQEWHMARSQPVSFASLNCRVFISMDSTSNDHY